MAVLTVDAIKPYLNVVGTSTNLSDAEIQGFINTAVTAIGNRVGPLEATSRTLRYRAYGAQQFLVLPDWPVSTVTITGLDGTVVDAGTYAVDPDTGLVETVDGTPFPAGTYVVTYTAGWSSLPADLLTAVQELVRHLAATQRGGGRVPGPSFANNPDGATVPGAAWALPNRVTQMLEPYLAPRFA